MPMEYSKDFFYWLVSCLLRSWKHFGTQLLGSLGIQNQLCEEMMLNSLISALIMKSLKGSGETYVILTFWDNKASNMLLWAPNSAFFVFQIVVHMKLLLKGLKNPHGAWVC